MLYVTIFCLFRRSFFEKRCLCSRKLWLTEVIDDELHLRTTVEVGILAHVEVLELFIERRDVFDPSCQTVDGNLLLAVGEVEHRQLRLPITSFFYHILLRFYDVNS